MTSASARPRWWAGTRDDAVELAVGVNMPAPSPATARLARTSPNEGSTTVRTLPRARTRRPTTSSRLRGQRAVVAATTGDDTAYVKANTVISRPALDTLTSSEREMSGRIPAMTKASVPTANVPKVRTSRRRYIWASLETVIDGLKSLKQ
jgi:hypothetical protein